MLKGLMQDVPLQISAILRFAAAAHGDREIVSRLVGEPIWRYRYSDMAKRAGKAANALIRLGVKPGDRVTSLAWNTHRHLELFYAAPGIGAVLHTANPRLSDDHIAYTINQAGSAVLMFDRTFLPLLKRLRPLLPNIQKYVPLASDNASLDAEFCPTSYEKLIKDEEPHYDWPRFDENTAAFLCFTSGTIGNPKGVLYSHRSVVLHALAAGLSGAFGLTAFDSIMPCQSMFHATAWGLPFVGPINGCKLVFPCEKMDASSLQELIQQEGVTFSGGVPTIWTGYLNHLERTGETTGKLRQLLIGGSAVPRAMAAKFEMLHDVKVRQIWGMTETSPVGVVGTPTPKLAALGEDALQDVLWTRQGRLQFGNELRIVDEDGNDLPWDGDASGALLVRGPWTVERYFGSAKSALNEQGWFDTGDIATIDNTGFMRITDRKKDLIKSGGEWISSIDIENVASAFPGVKVVGVVGIPHPKWEERPLMVVEAHPDISIRSEEILEFLKSKVVKWWLPDAIIFADVPLTSVGKVDKKALRARYGEYFAISAPLD